MADRWGTFEAKTAWSGWKSRLLPKAAMDLTRSLPLSLARSLSCRNGKQTINGNVKQVCEEDQFLIRDATQAGLNLGQCFTTDIEPLDLATRGELLLGQPQIIPELLDLRPDHIGWFFRHARIGLDAIRAP